MERSQEFDGERALGYRAPVSPYQSVSPYVAQSRTFLRYYPEGTRELIDELFDQILELPEEDKFSRSAKIFAERFEREMTHPFLRYLPISREMDAILTDLYEVFKEGQRSTVNRLIGLDDPRSHLVVVVYTELIMRAIDILRGEETDPIRCISAVLPLIIRLDKAHGNREMTDGFITDCALADYYLQRSVGEGGEDHPSQYDFELLEYDILSFGVVITYRESDISSAEAASVLDLSEEDFEKLVELHGVA